MAKVSWMKSVSSNSAQIYSSGIQLCFVSDDMRQCHPFVFCKDFLQDVVWANLHNKSISPHGFAYNPGKNPRISFNITRIAAVNERDSSMGDKVEGVIDFLNQICKQLHLKRTTVKSVEPPGKYSKCGAYVFDGSNRWMNSPPFLSMYTLLLRIGFVHKKGAKYMDTINGVINGKIKPYQSNDRSYLTSAKPTILNIMELGYRKFFFIDNEKNYPGEVNVYSIHDSCGIVGMTNRSSRSVVKYWTRKSLQEKLAEKSKQGETHGA